MKNHPVFYRRPMYLFAIFFFLLLVPCRIFAQSFAPELNPPNQKRERIITSASKRPILGNIELARRRDKLFMKFRSVVIKGVEY